MVDVHRAIVCCRFIDWLSDDYIASDWRPEAPVRDDEVVIDDRVLVVTRRRWLSPTDINVYVTPDRRSR